MFKKYLIVAMTVCVLNLSLSTFAFAASNEEKDARFAGKVKADVAKLGTGKDARIEVKLRDGTKLKGYVNQADENSFVVINEKTATAVEVPYSKAKKVRGINLNTGIAIAIGVVVFTVVLMILFHNGVIRDD